MQPRHVHAPRRVPSETPALDFVKFVSGRVSIERGWPGHCASNSGGHDTIRHKGRGAGPFRGRDQVPSGNGD